MNRSSKTIYRTTFVATCVALLTICSWLSVPFFINITFQVFAVFLIASVSRPIISSLSVICYIALGLIGVPVFSGFGNGISALMGASGGFIIGFFISALLISLFSDCYSEKRAFHLVIMLASLVICYLCGTLWYAFVFNYSVHTPLLDSLMICVLPFIIPDALKIFLVWIVYRKLCPYLKRLVEKM